jgi:DnaD/phage-associated family protein
MTVNYWLKLWTDILDDMKLAPLPEFIKWRFVLLLAVAKEYNKSGLLPPVAALAWRLRLDEDKIAETLSALSQVGIAATTPDGWIIVNFEKRQSSADPNAGERMQRYRERRTNLGLATNVPYSTKSIIERDYGKCVYCGSSKNLCVDHIIPLILGGTDDELNLVASCKSCNSGKGGRTPEMAGYIFFNKEAEKRYKEYVTVSRYVSPSVSDSASDSLFKLNNNSAEIFRAYESEIGALTSHISQAIDAAISDYPQEWILESIKIASRNNARSWAYCEAILKRWQTDGFKSNNKPPKSTSKSASQVVDEWAKSKGILPDGH